MELISDLFLKALKNYFRNSKWGDQAKIARSAKISQKVLNNILAGRNYGSEEQRRAIASACGYPDRAYEDFLDIGRALMAEKDPAECISQRPTEVVNIMITGLTSEQIKILQRLRDLLITGGEGVEIISDSIINLSEKKLSSQGTAVYQKNN